MKAQFEKKLLPNAIHTYANKYKNLHNLPHWHIEYELIIALSGNASLMINNYFYEIREGDCAFISSEEIHHIKAAPDCILGIIKTDAEYIKKIIGNTHLLSPILKHNNSAKSYFDTIFSEVKSKKEFHDIASDIAVTNFILEIFRTEAKTLYTNSKKEASVKYKDLIEMLASNYTHITFEDAAKYVNLNKAYFSRYFYRFAGITFTQYINTLKVSSAIEKILEKKLNMTEISIECGFGTIRSFNRIFKEFTGYSPKKLPDDYIFIYNSNDKTSNAFDPTLNCTEILE